MKINFIFLLFIVLFTGLQNANAQSKLSAEDAEKIIVMKPEPIYNDFAKEMKAQGEVTVELTVLENGTVSKVRFLSGNPTLIAPAVETGKKYQFKPYLVNGKPTSFTTVLKIFFTLGSTKEDVKNEEETARRYFDESDRCRKFIKERKWIEAGKSCQSAVFIAEKLPSNREMEKHSAYLAMAYVNWWQENYTESIQYSNKALEVAKNKLDDTDSETGEVYFLLGASHQGLKDFDKAKEFYNKAENSYRAAYIKIDDDEIRARYPKMIQNILNAHLRATMQSGSKDEIEAIQKRISELKNQYAQSQE
jgi:TonB family protein